MIQDCSDSECLVSDDNWCRPTIRFAAGPDRDAYYHSRFLRGQPVFVHRIERKKRRGKSQKETHSPYGVPDFYGMPYMELERRPVQPTAELRMNMLTTDGLTTTYATSIDWASLNQHLVPSYGLLNCHAQGHDDYQTTGSESTALSLSGAHRYDLNAAVAPTTVMIEKVIEKGANLLKESTQ